MIITLKDGSKKEYAEAKSVIDIAADISEGLARVACAGEVDGEVVDLRHVVDKDCELSILTFEDEGGKGAFRHTTSHIMAQAIKRLYPDVKLAIGPSIADGFYYDIDSENPMQAHVSSVPVPGYSQTSPPDAASLHILPVLCHSV